MPMTITRRYHFEAGHWLPRVPEGHRCRRQHGHNYVVDMTIGGDIDETGFVIDFWDLDSIVQPIINIVDHRNLNDIPGLENPTAENIAKWFFGKIQTGTEQKWISNIRVWETPDCWVDFHGSFS